VCVCKKSARECVHVSAKCLFVCKVYVCVCEMCVKSVCVRQRKREIVCVCVCGERLCV
jgi:hypothetical protein